MHQRIIHITADIAFGVGNRYDAADGAAAVDADGEAGLFLLHALAQKGGGAERAPQGGRGGGGAVVDLPGPLDRVPCRDDGHFHRALGCGGVYDLIHVLFSSHGGDE